MCGGDNRTEGLFSSVNWETRVLSTHPLRAIRGICDEVLEVLSPEFDTLYSKVGRPSIPPEKLLQAFHSNRNGLGLVEIRDSQDGRNVIQAP